MIVNVELWAFREGEVREVEVPDRLLKVNHVGPDNVEGEKEFILERVFYWGQNDHQPKDQPSVSMGDVAVLPNGERWAYQSIGWVMLTYKEYQEYISKPRIDRVLQSILLIPQNG